MTLTVRSIIGGYIIALAPMVWQIVAPIDPIAEAGAVDPSYFLMAIAAALVAYFLVFSRAKNRVARLVASIGVALAFLLTYFFIWELAGRRPLALVPPLETLVALSLIAGAFVAAAAIVARIAASKKVKLATS